MHRIIVCEVTQLLRFKMFTIPISINLDAHIKSFNDMYVIKFFSYIF